MSTETTQAINEITANPHRWQNERDLFYALIENDAYTPDEAMETVLLLRGEKVQVYTI